MIEKISRFLGSRRVQFIAIPALVFVWFLATDPSGGADTLLRVQLWAQALFVTGLAYLIAKALLGNTSSQRLYEEAMKFNTAAGVAYLGVCLLRSVVLLGLLHFFATVTR